MDQNIEKILNTLESQKIVTVDLKFVDLFGTWRHLSIPASSLDKEFFNTGVGFDSSSVPGFKSIEAGDMVLLPDPQRFFVDPFWKQPALSLFCNIVEADSHRQFNRDPRSIARRAEQYLKQTGFATESRWGPEFEYHVFDAVSIVNRPSEVGYRIFSEEAGWCNPAVGKPEAIQKFGGYHAMPPRDSLYNIRSETVQLIEQCGIKIHYHHHEVGAAGQTEIEVKRYPLLEMGDFSMMIKYFIKMVAKKHGKTVTFMPKPIFDDAGNGMHFHQHLFKDGTPVFYDEDGYGGLSDLARHYVAGILTHAPALLGFTNPSTNSYKRLVPGYEAPVYSFFSTANRTAAIRIPKYATQPTEKRIEFRPPDASCNIYTAMAAMLMAGIDGIEKKLEPKQLGLGPYDVNIFDMPEEKRPKLLPSSLEDALKALENDCDFLLKGGVFTKDIIATWIDYKQKQCHSVSRHPHPYEHSLYYDV